MDSTKVFVDSIKAVISYSSEVLASTQKCQTNWLDVAIVAIICLSVIAIVSICVCGYKCIKKQEIDSRNQSENDKREWEKEDKISKQKMALNDMKLNFLKELCYDEIETIDEEIESETKKEKEEVKESVHKKTNNKKDKKLKAFISEEVQSYLKELNS